MKSLASDSPNHSLLPISVVIIALNEARNIGDCIDSVRGARQVVVLDGGSRDATVAIATAKGAQVSVNSEWAGFGVQKNRALALANQPWILSLDADERVTPELWREIEMVIARGHLCAVQLPRLTQFCGQWIHHCGWTPDYVTRLWPKGAGQFTDDLVHERVVTKNLPSQRLHHVVLHYSYPTPSHYWNKLSQYSQAWALQRHLEQKTTSMTRAYLSGIYAFLKSYLWRCGFLDGAMGLVVCSMQAQAAFGKYLTLYCLQRQSHKQLK